MSVVYTEIDSRARNRWKCTQGQGPLIKVHQNHNMMVFHIWYDGWNNKSIAGIINEMIRILVTLLIAVVKCSLEKHPKGGWLYFSSQLSVLSIIVRRYESRNTAELGTLPAPESGIRQRWMLVLSSLSPFYSFQGPSTRNGAYGQILPS